MWSFCSSCVASLTSRSVAPLICLRPWQVWVMGLWWQHWPGFRRRRICFVMFLCVSQQRHFTGKRGSVFKFTSYLYSLYNFSRVLFSLFFISQSEMRCIIVVVAKARVLSGKYINRNIFYVSIWIQMWMLNKYWCVLCCLWINPCFWINLLVNKSFFAFYQHLKHVTAELPNILKFYGMLICSVNVLIMLNTYFWGVIGCFAVICGENNALTLFLEFFTLLDL